jgi:hypothetical protein
MAKEITFDLTIRFSEKITSDDDFKEISENICKAIVREVENYGIAPEESDVFVEWVSINHPLSGIKSLRKLVS